MNISILTLFPEMFRGPFDLSIIKRAQEAGIVSLDCINIRDYSTDRYKSVDDHPYGGGVGMIMRVDILDHAIESVKLKVKSVKLKTKIILLDPTGTPFTQAKANELSLLNHLIVVCGHYEGVDERVRSLVDEQISIGDYVLTGGEVPAMVIVDSVIRLLPGVLKKQTASQEESFSTLGGRLTLEHPQYTRPLLYKGMKVPDILLTGNHAKIETWKRDASRKKTKAIRPNLLKD